MKKSLLFLLIISLFVSCNQKNKFRVHGKVIDGAGKILYFEHNGLTATVVLDSVKLGSDGEFSFKSVRPKYPDLYRLRLNGNIITFGVDSCENISVDAKMNNFATDYTLTGSETSLQIQKLRKSVMNIQTKVNQINQTMTVVEQNAKIADIEKDIDVHKDMARKLILQNPRSLAAYFAIYQQINNTYLFSPYQKEDKPYCAAVATSFTTFMPEYERSKNLYNLVIDAIKQERNQKEKQTWNQILSKADAGYINIVLPDNKNVERKLSSIEGKVVLIDFAIYETKQNADYTLSLRDLYKKYHNRGFEIFQISVDKDKTAWQQAVETIPWICVRDENGQETKYLDSYNVKAIPTAFILNKKGVIVGRYNSIPEIQAAVEKNL